VPGQIASLRAGEYPQGWSPVWVILMERRKGSVIFCGADLNDSRPQPNRDSTRRSLQDWKEMLWYRRKRIDPPGHAALKRLWMEYQLEAQKQ
jgi:hypothetical protein